MDIQNLETRHVMVDLRDIEDYPGPYCMSFGFDLGPLIRSIENVGMINPPLLIGNRGGAHKIISGYRRILALKALDHKRTRCRLLSKHQLSALECLLLNLHDNLATRGLNEVEMAMVLSRLASLVSREQILDRYMPLLGLSPHIKTLDLFLRLERELEDEPKHHLAKGRVSLKSAAMLLEIEPGVRSRVFDLMATLKLNTNQQKQFVDYLVDLAHISKISISDLLKDKPFESVLQKKDMNWPQKAKAILRLLRGMRYPTLVQAEEEFKKNVARLDLPEGIRIIAPPYFESPDYRLEIRFTNGKGLREKIDKLQRKEGIEGLGSPWEQRE